MGGGKLGGASISTPMLMNEMAMNVDEVTAAVSPLSSQSYGNVLSQPGVQTLQSPLSYVSLAKIIGTETQGALITAIRPCSSS